MSQAAEPTAESPAKAEPWSIQRVLRWAAEDFGKRGNPSPRLDAELLLAHALRTDRIRLVIESERYLDEAELGRVRELIRRRRNGEPIAYILGQREFYGLPFVVDARALVPRPDTEPLVEVALERTRERFMYGRALDLCTGTGCVALAFAKARPTWRVSATDISSDTAALAWENTRRLGAASSVRVLVGDLFAPVAGERFELIVGNPPYIPHGDIAGLERDVRAFEPHLALDGGADGLDVVRKIVSHAHAHLVPGGLLALEIGFDQADAVAQLFQSAGFSEVQRRRDYGNRERVISGRMR
jgi:release factor glutamine methyltransferase